MKKLTVEECKEKMKRAHGNIYDYSLFISYNGHLDKIPIICKKHGTFTQMYNNHVRGHGCPKCKSEKNRRSFKSNIIEFIKKARKIHGDIYNYDFAKYKSIMSKIEIVCSKHGSFWQTPNNHISKKCGCPKCRDENLSKMFSDTNESFIEKAKAVHGNLYLYNKIIYNGSDNKVEIICRKHGSFWQTPHNHLVGKGCKKCAKVVSKPETAWLDLYSIPKKNRNVRFKINNRWFNVDGIDYKTNTIYEFYGDFWHGNPKKFKKTDVNGANKKSFGELYRNTLDREEFLKKAGYNIVSIWESDFVQH